MKRIDFHTHAYPDKLAQYIIEKLTSVSGYKSNTDGTFLGLREYMKNQNVNKFVLLNIASSPKQQKSANDFMLNIEYPECFPFIAVHPDSEDCIYEIDRGIDKGLKGVKFHPEYQNFDMSDNKYYKIYEYCLNKGLVIIFHAGFDPAFTSQNSCPEKSAKVAEDFKTKQIVLAHMGDCKNINLSFEYLINKTVSFDISMSYIYQNEKTITDFIKTAGVDKFVYGSDSPFGDEGKTLAFLNSLQLSEEEKNCILYKNAEKLLKIKL